LFDQVPKVEIFLFRSSIDNFLPFVRHWGHDLFTAVAVSSVGIPNINLSIPDRVTSKLVASVAAAASTEMFALAVAGANGGVRSMASITVLILRFFFPSTFL
jgi:hypothetical protein